MSMSEGPVVTIRKWVVDVFCFPATGMALMYAHLAIDSKRRWKLFYLALTIALAGAFWSSLYALISGAYSSERAVEILRCVCTGIVVITVAHGNAIAKSGALTPVIMPRIEMRRPRCAQMLKSLLVLMLSVTMLCGIILSTSILMML